MHRNKINLANNFAPFVRQPGEKESVAAFRDANSGVESRATAKASVTVHIIQPASH
jgi:hypothetical protein